MGFWLYHFDHGRYCEALSEARKVNGPNVILRLIATAAALARLGRKKQAAAAIGDLLEIDPNYGDRVADDFAARNVHPALAEKIIQSLRAAGLPGMQIVQ